MTNNSRKRHTPEHVIRKLGHADRMLADGSDIAAVCGELGVSEQTYHRWRNSIRWSGGRGREAVEGAREAERHAQAAAGRSGAGKAALKGWLRTLLRPGRRRSATAHLINTLMVSERMACRLAGLSRSAYRRPLNGDTMADPDRALP
jgi:hypothetical protein